MDLFPSIGLAVLGIFATVAFGGMMSGVIAFGVVDGGLRRRVQRGVVRRLVEEQLERFLDDQMEQEDGVRPERWESAVVAQPRDTIPTDLRGDAGYACGDIRFICPCCHCQGHFVGTGLSPDRQEYLNNQQTGPYYPDQTRHGAHGP